MELLLLYFTDHMSALSLVIMVLVGSFLIAASGIYCQDRIRDGTSLLIAGCMFCVLFVISIGIALFVPLCLQPSLFMTLFTEDVRMRMQAIVVMAFIVSLVVGIARSQGKLKTGLGRRLKPMVA